VNDDAPGLEVGDLVVYASHGIGRVKALGAGGETVVLELPQELSVTLPIDRARELLRPLSSEPDIARIKRTLRGAETAAASTWSKRFNATREKVTAGDVVGLAEVVRDGVIRERRAAAQGGSAASPTERHLYLKARKLLAEEIGRSRGIDPELADAWIVDQVEVPSSDGA
jgi:RNA polymerase-interacting CarD/CdnL/TRCF family regulator